MQKISYLGCLGAFPAISAHLYMYVVFTRGDRRDDRDRLFVYSQAIRRRDYANEHQSRSDV